MPRLHNYLNIYLLIQMCLFVVRMDFSTHAVFGTIRDTLTLNTEKSALLLNWTGEGSALKGESRAVQYGSLWRHYDGIMRVVLVDWMVQGYEKATKSTLGQAFPRCTTLKWGCTWCSSEFVSLNHTQKREGGIKCTHLFYLCLHFQLH